MEAIQSKLPTSKVQCSEDVSEVKSDVSVKMEEDCDEVMSKGNQRENRLTSIIDQLRCQSKMKDFCVDIGLDFWRDRGFDRNFDKLMTDFRAYQTG
ncbi:unnamed protein product [Arctia plantaginis]|uniref:Uncharacterized protein n=1 Tax=Arctia plantaginis TaxID=874455 RepID=A0A8S1BT62_ARCPL|nr:unnamed protein product [Arctia plantaginis]